MSQLRTIGGLEATEILSRIRTAYDEWMAPDCSTREQAIHRTVQLGHVLESDIRFQLKAIQDSLHKPSAQEWARRAELAAHRGHDFETSSDAAGPLRRSLADGAVLCLNAGNLPMVGFQDLVAVLLSGHSYLGKVSRQDPFLLPSFLELLSPRLAERIHVSLELKDLASHVAPGGGVEREPGSPSSSGSPSSFGSLTAGDAPPRPTPTPESQAQSPEREKPSLKAILFAGSEETASEIQDIIAEAIGAYVRSLPILLRTASYSVAYLASNTSEAVDHLVESIFRHKGAGCRSVTAIISPYSLADLGSSIQHSYARLFTPAQAAAPNLTPLQTWMFAYHLASNHPTLQLGDVLLAQSPSPRVLPGLVIWIQGGMVELEDLLSANEKRIQCVYGTGDAFTSSGEVGESEPPLSRSLAEMIDSRFPSLQLEQLADAQTPGLNWKPDGTDPLEWLMGLRHRNRH